LLRLSLKPLPELNHIKAFVGENNNLERLSSLEGRTKTPQACITCGVFGEFECAYGFPLPPEPGDGADGWDGA
jgi:hypothetical protein